MSNEQPTPKKEHGGFAIVNTEFDEIVQCYCNEETPEEITTELPLQLNERLFTIRVVIGKEATNVVREGQE